MPFTVTTYNGEACHDECAHPNLDHRASGEGCISSDGRWLDDTRAVATIAQARDYADQRIFATARELEDPAVVRCRDTAFNLPETGGTIGPLPDGVVIEVSVTDWQDLAGRAGLIYAPGTFTVAEILDAFNGRSH